MIVLFLAAIGAAIYAFCRPRGAYRFAGLAILAAIVLPFVLGYGLSPFLGEGAGMGVAFILYALSAMIATLALSALCGASLRHGWNMLR